MFSFATGDVFREPQGHGFSAFLLSDEKKHFLDGLLVGEALVLLHWFHVGRGTYVRRYHWQAGRSSMGWQVQTNASTDDEGNAGAANMYFSWLNY